MKIWDKEILDNYASKHADVTSTLQRWVDFVEYNKTDSKTI